MRRCSVKFVDGATRNAEQIELFYNARQSDQSEDGNVFVCSDYLRQVTYSLSTTMGVARQEVGEYQHFWMFRRQASGPVRAHDLICSCAPSPPTLVFFVACPLVYFTHPDDPRMGIGDWHRCHIHAGAISGNLLTAAYLQVVRVCFGVHGARDCDTACFVASSACIVCHV